MEDQGLSKRQVTRVGLEMWWKRLKELEAKEDRFVSLLDEELRRSGITN